MSAVFLDVGRWTVISLGISFPYQCKAGMAAAFTLDNILFKANERRERVLHEQVTKALAEHRVFERGGMSDAIQDWDHSSADDDLFSLSP